MAGWCSFCDVTQCREDEPRMHGRQAYSEIIVPTHHWISFSPGLLSTKQLMLRLCGARYPLLKLAKRPTAKPQQSIVSRLIQVPSNRYLGAKISTPRYKLSFTVPSLPSKSASKPSSVPARARRPAGSTPRYASRLQAPANSCRIKELGRRLAR